MQPVCGRGTLGNVNTACTIEMDTHWARAERLRRHSDSRHDAMRCQNWINKFSFGAFAQLFVVTKQKFAVYIFWPPQIKHGLARKIAFIVRHIKHTKTFRIYACDCCCRYTPWPGLGEREMLMYIFSFGFCTHSTESHPPPPPSGCKAIKWN